MIPSAHRRALLCILQKLENFPHPWVVTGSCGLALQGMPLEVHDIDLQTCVAGAFEMERLLCGQQIIPVRLKLSEKIHSFFGALELEGIKVEIMGDIQRLLPDGSWQEPVDIPTQRIWVSFENQRVPVFSLAYELEAYRLLGRTQRAAEIEAWLKKTSTH